MKEVIDRNPRDNHGQTPLHLAAKNGHLKVCKTIIKEADDKNPKDNQGMTPFHIAALMGHEKICKLFMSSVDDYNPKTVNGRTPISCAAQNDHSGIKNYRFLTTETNSKALHLFFCFLHNLISKAFCIDFTNFCLQLHFLEKGKKNIHKTFHILKMKTHFEKEPHFV